MHPIIRNILAVIFGWFTGSVVNMSLIQLGNKLLPIPGIDPNDMSALAEVIPTLNAQYFIFPFLAHALGTLIGALVAALIAFNHKIKFALAIGVLFLLGGITVNYMLPGPTWFTITDIALAYLPMAWLGGTFAIRRSKTKN